MEAYRIPAERLSEIAASLSDASALEDVCRALDEGRLNRHSSAPVLSAVASGRYAVEGALHRLHDIWEQAPACSGAAIALALRCSAAAAVRLQKRHPATQVVWTGPHVEGSFLRSTREVVRELLRLATCDILVVGYWIAASDDGEGIIEEVIGALANAVERGVRVTVIVDERRRADGRDNKQALVDAWPQDVALPKLLTWRLPSDDRHLKLHAKVLVADGADALVTSANLTYYAMDRNMEMGVRVRGAPASAIAAHFNRLVASGVIEDFEDEGET